MNADTAIELGKLVLAFGRVERATYHEDGLRPETDTDHTVMLGLIAAEAAASMRAWGSDLDVGLVVQYALVHDLVEALVGDVNSFGITPELKAAKDLREAEALTELYDQFGKTCPWLCHRLQEYEEQQVPEARFVRYLDKAMPKITHKLNGCAAIKRMGKTPGELIMAHDKQLVKLRILYPEFEGTVAERLQEELMKASEDAYVGTLALCSICNKHVLTTLPIRVQDSDEQACGNCVRELLDELETNALERGKRT
jgi:5'-deoxynucleotidase YfbR-like HD superfamily hydrolase